MNYKMKKFIALLAITLTALPLSANLKYDNANLKTKIYFSYSDKVGQDALVKGKIISISTSEALPENELSGMIQDKTKATVRLIDNEGLHSENTLYVIDPNNLVVSKLQVKYIFDNKTMGNMLIGYGNFKLSNEGYRVVKAVADDKAGDSFIYKTRGDYYYRTGDKGKAIAEYKKAIEMDRSNPSPRLALGLVYYKDEIYNFAYAELIAAYNSISSLYDNEDRFILLKSLAEIRAIEAYRNVNLFENRVKFRKEGIKFCKEALRVHKNSVEVNYLLGEFYYRNIDNKTDDEKLARDMFLKVIELDQSHAGANIRLSELYNKHNNKEKGLYYAKKASESDPANQKALEIIKPYE
ncbi:MAG TPA: tetratricopeptide repeat protein [Spirochaetota bacterium]|nr:tetratricopeptide repeat protein [Spirochaetota bacterium]HPS85418.1 tetratricopeptide repeat protein [Spirochaetota bacterium]